MADSSLPEPSQEFRTVDNPGSGSVQPGSVGPNPGESLCRYRRLREHAKGGLGQVSLAQDAELQREVALKEIQDRFADHQEARQRFVREAQITGYLEHPGIVPVYGLGAYPDGRPYYAMRFIRGQSLLEAIKTYHTSQANPLEMRKLLHRFVLVCNAVAFAHSRGIIHRDLKPANIMLGDYGETLVVDWGLARVLDREEEATLPQGWMNQVVADEPTQTMQGETLGTPNYMPPEQAIGQRDLVGPASDIFSLGATLYCLLTGKPPYPGSDALERAKVAGWVPARAIKRDVPAALEAVCARAMATEPERRYPSADELGEEIEHFLADEPIKAYREPILGRMRRWGRKNRSLVTSGVLLLLLSIVGLVIGLGAVSAEQARTARQRDKAQENEERAIKAEKAATENLTTAEANLSLAKKAVNETFDIAKNNPLLQQDTMQEVRKLLLEKALPFYERFRIGRGDDLASRRELGDHYFRLGDINTMIGDPGKARRAYKQAAEVYRGLVKDQPKSVIDRDVLAGALNNLAIGLEHEGKHDEARKLHQEALAIRLALLKEHPRRHDLRNDLARTYHNQASALRDRGKGTEAVKLFQQARAIREALVKEKPTADHYSDLSLTLGSLANVLRSLGRRAESIQIMLRNRAIQQALIKVRPQVGQHRAGLAMTLLNLGVTHMSDGNFSEARKTYEQARDLLQPLVRQQPGVVRYRADLGTLLNNLGNAIKRQGKTSEALRPYLDAIDLQRDLVKEQPAITSHRSDLAQTLTNLGILYVHLNEHDKAGKAYAEARTIREKLLKDHPATPEFASDLAVTLINQGNGLFYQGKRDEGLKNSAQAIALLRSLVKRLPTFVAYRRDLAKQLGTHATMLDLAGNPSAGIGYLEEACDEYKRLIELAPTVGSFRADHVAALAQLATTLGKVNKEAEAMKAFTAAIATAEAYVEKEPRSFRLRGELGNALFNRAQRWQALKQPEKKLADLNSAIVHMTKVLKLNPASTVVRENLRRTHLSRMYTLMTLKRHREASESARKALLGAPASSRTGLRALLAENLARAGAHREAIREIILLTRDKHPASRLNTLGQLAALCAGDLARDANRPLPERETYANIYAKFALIYLRRAQQSGYFKTAAHRDALRTNKDLDYLRNRADFKRFLLAVEPP